MSSRNDEKELNKTCKMETVAPESEEDESKRICRRSVIVVDEALFGSRLVEQLSKIDSFSDENILRSVARTCEGDVPNVIEALSLEVGPWSTDALDESKITWRRSFCVTDLVTACLEENSEALAVVGEILDDLLELVVDGACQAEMSNAVEEYTHFYHPLAGKEDIARMTDVLKSTQLTLADDGARLQAAYRIILVQSAKQIVVSYRRILLEQNSRLQSGLEDRNVIAEQTVAALLDVTRRVAELAVEYLKAATRNVVDSSVQEIKIILGKLHEDQEIEHLTEL